MKKHDFYKLFLPYGCWEENDGSRVLFNRRYHPLWRVRADGSIQPMRQNQKIFFINQTFFYDDTNPPHRCRETRTRLIGILEKVGIFPAAGPR